MAHAQDQTPILMRTPRGLRSSPMRFSGTKGIALLMIGMGIAFVCFPTFGVAAGGGGFMWIFVAPFIAAGLFMMGLGLFMALGSVRVITRPGRLGMRAELVLWGWTFWVPAQRLTDLRLRMSTDKDGSAGIEGVYRLEARFNKPAAGQKESALTHGGHTTIAAGNDHAWLLEWAQTLSTELDVPLVRQRAFDRAIESADEGDTTQRPPADAVYPQPPEGVVSWVEETPGGVTLYALPDAHSKGFTRTLIGLGVLFPLIAGGVGAMFISSLWGTKGATLQLLGIGSVVVLFVGGGFYALVCGIRGKRARWIVDITEGTLLLNARTMRGKVSAVLPAAHVTRVSVADTGTSYGGTEQGGGTPVREVRIAPRHARALSILKGSSDASLDWAAEVLRIALALDPSDTSPETDEQETDEPEAEGFAREAPE